MYKNDKHVDKNDRSKSGTSDSFLSSFLSDFSDRWKRFDKEFDEMDERIEERKKLNGKATNHEIDL
ncbi:hypothetical protein ACTXJ5_05725 [Psychrobacter alimentarius]|uniref:hypothetical protein n=1 Tax=Psychrobacter alimentarius TaxID=261164 RepID=UPI003FCF0DA7